MKEKKKTLETLPKLYRFEGNEKKSSNGSAILHKLKEFNSFQLNRSCVDLKTYEFITHW